jgi:nucleotide-binding universal stress UspA family protein
MSPNQYQLQAAIHDFQSARQKAGIQEVLARLTGKSNQLLSYEEVAEKLKLHARADGGIQQIPLDAIVGSTGRYTEFTRTFLPRRVDDQERWARVKAAFDASIGLPPIEVLKVGDVYFVVDGNHRVSIARQEKLRSIEAHVVEVRTPIPLTPDVQPDDLIIKAEYADFLEATHITDLRPNVDLTVTIPGQYAKLMEQICCQECYLEKGGECDFPFEESVQDWYDSAYIPLAETIRDRGLLRWFPGRTVTDLYLWISDNRSALEKELGWQIQSEIAATDLILEKGLRNKSGSWRKARTVKRYADRLFTDILVPLGGDVESWDALEQAITVAEREGARLLGLHVLESKEYGDTEHSRPIQAAFDHGCAAANVEGKLIVESGEISAKIRERAAMADLLVMKITHPPAGGLSMLRSAFRTIITNSSVPVLVVPQKPTRFQRALLAYDGSLRAKEALFVAAYLAEIWKTELTVFTALDGGKTNSEIHGYVRQYLEFHEVNADYVIQEGNANASLNKAVEEHNCDLVLMGGYGSSVIRDLILGSAVDFMLRESNVPILVCR